MTMFSTKKIFAFLFIIAAFISNISAQEAAVATEEKSATAVYNDGVAAMKAKDFKTSYTLLESAIAKATADKNDEVLNAAKKSIIPVAYSYGNELLKAKNNKEALTIFQKGLEIDPTVSLMHQGIARSKEESGDVDGAAASYMSYLDGAQKENDAKKVGEVQARMKSMLIKQLTAKSYARVIKLGTEYLEKDKNQDISYLVGKAHAEKGDHTNGIKFLSESVEQTTAAGGKVEDKVYYALGTSYEAKKDNKNAIKYLKMITDPKFKAAAQATITKLGGK